MAATKKTSGKASATRKGSAGKASGAKKAITKKSSPKRRSAPKSTAAGAPPVDYAREAFSEWRKAARLGAAALWAPRRAGTSKEKPPLKERLNPATTEKGGRVGDALDELLSKLGFLGKSASKLSLGSRAIEKLRPDVLDKL